MLSNFLPDLSRLGFEIPTLNPYTQPIYLCNVQGNFGGSKFSFVEVKTGREIASVKREGRTASVDAFIK